MKRFAKRMLRFLSESSDDTSPKKMVRFSGKWIDANLPVPSACNVFFGHINSADIQILFGISNFVTEEISPSTIISLSPQKVRELRDFLSNVIQAYEARFGPTTSTPPDTNNNPPPPPTMFH